MRRHDAGLSQRELADAIHVSKSLVAKIELGQATVRIHDLVAMAARLGCDTALLLPRVERLELPVTVTVGIGDHVTRFDRTIVL